MGLVGAECCGWWVLVGLVGAELFFQWSWWALSVVFSGVSGVGGRSLP